MACPNIGVDSGETGQEHDLTRGFLMLEVRLSKSHTAECKTYEHNQQNSTLRWTNY